MNFKNFVKIFLIFLLAVGILFQLRGYFWDKPFNDTSSLEVEVFKSKLFESEPYESEVSSSLFVDLPENKSTPTLSYMVDSSSNWKFFNTSVITSYIDGIKIQTSSSESYYLTYKTLSSGQSDFCPEVSSTTDSFSGSAGNPIQLLSIHAYNNDGTKLTTGIVVIYRAYVDGEWLEWVSNADPKWTASVQVKYNLDGAIDTNSSYAGKFGSNISGIEIRIFEENNIETQIEPTDNYKIIQVPFISQSETYPTGCESVSAVMALNYWGISTSVDTFIDDYLYITDIAFDPNISFGGDPRGVGFGCYAPVIKNALDKILDGESYYAEELNNVSLQDLCSQYIDNDIPVILWATINMQTPVNKISWTYNGETITWIQSEHCLLLVGYDDNNYIFNDPWKEQSQTYYNKAQVAQAYAGLKSQAVVILEDNES